MIKHPNRSIGKILSTMLLIILCVCSSLKGICQAQDPALNPKVIPPSPDAQAFMKYGEIPVSHTTGTPNIEIPIYDIISSKLKLPIKLTYHTSIRPSDIASCVGLGWRLAAGGVLTRTIKGKVDESPIAGILTYGLLTKSDIDNGAATQNFYEHVKNQAYGHLDNSSDNYYYSVGNSLSGEFVYNENQQIVKVTYNSDKIVRTSQNTFEVTDDEGTFYQFDHKETVFDDAAWHPGSWWITKMISSDKTDTISFEYDDQPYYFSDVIASQSMEVMPCFDKGLYPMELITNKTNVISHVSLLRRINFSGGHIEFDYLNDRTDLRDSRLKNVSIYDNNSMLLRKVVLDHAYFWSRYSNTKYNYRLKLTSLTTRDGTDAPVHNYAFQYNESNILPPYREPAGDDSFLPPNAVDYWGFYNGKTQNPNMIPVLPYYFVPGDRKPVEEYAKACLLEKIIYPTGGYTSFKYTANQLGESGGYTSNPMLTGGLRVSEIVSTADAGSVPVKKTYEYMGGVSLMPMGNDGSYVYYQDVKDVVPCAVICLGPSSTYVSNAVVPLNTFNGSPVIYTAVNEYIIGADADLKTSYLYDVEADQMEYVEYPRYRDENYINRNWARGNLLATGFYKKKNGSYQLIRSIGNTYVSLMPQQIIIGTQLQKKLRWLREAIGCGMVDGYHPYTSVKDYFYILDDKIDLGLKKIASTTTVDYDDQGNYTVATENFTYGSPNHFYPTKKSVVNSRGQAIETVIKYPHDFSSVAPYSEMINRNMVAVPIEEISTNVSLNKELSHKKTNYDFFHSNQLIQPSSIDISYGGLTLRAERTILSYDQKGNPLTVLPRNGPITSYQWSYNKKYPVVECKNSTAQEFYYKDFEDPAGNNTLTGFAHTGTGYTDSPIIVWGLPNNKNYVISYWYRFNGIWVYSGEMVYAPLQNSNVFQMTGGDAYDDVRIYPKDSQMTTYTYKPLVGMTSATDAKGMTTYFEYDAFQRLKNVRDQNGNILKHTDYHYKP